MVMKYCFIKDEETGLVQLGVGCPDEYYIEIGMKQRDVKQSDIDLQWYLAELCPMKTPEQLLEEARQNKYQENETIRDEFLVSGVIYKGILWDSDIEQKLNLSIQTSSMSVEDVVTWVAMDGITSMECTKLDLLNIGALLVQMTAYVWQFKNPQIKTAIANAETIEELDAITIEYSLNEINIQSDNLEEVENL